MVVGPKFILNRITVPYTHSVFHQCPINPLVFKLVLKQQLPFIEFSITQRISFLDQTTTDIECVYNYTDGVCNASM